MKNVVYNPTLKGAQGCELITLDKSRKATWSFPKSYCNPYQKVPDCREFKIKLGSWDPLFESYGMSRRKKPTMKIIPYGNRKMNRYLEHQVIRLNSLRNKKSPAFWTVAKFLIEKSSVFLTLGVNHVFPQWHRKQPLGKILACVRKVRSLQRAQEDTIDYRRVYIPKNDGKFRPLGVPTPEWRVHLHMWAQIFSIYLYDKLSDSQHGFIPGRGTLTAWQEVLRKLKSSRDIFEFDLKDCFGQIRIDAVEELMQIYGIPSDIAGHFYHINMSVPKLPKVHLLDETKYIERAKSMEFGQRYEFVGWGKDGRDLRNQEGLPQGAPTSPILTNLVLMHTLYSYQPIVGYADDGMAMGNLPHNIADLFTQPDYGLKIKESSRYVKKNGTWQHKLKFLGMIYDPFKEELRSETRKGNSLILTDREGRLMEEFEGRIENKYSRPSLTWEKYITSKLAGFIQSRMYQGEWKLESFLQDFEYTYRNDSWSSKIPIRLSIDIFNSSSVASAWLTEKIRKRSKSPGFYWLFRKHNPRKRA